MSKLFDFKEKSSQGLKVRAKSTKKAEIVLYGGIGKSWWGGDDMISAKQFSDELKKIDNSVTEIDVRINSPGGDVFDGISIYNLLKQHKAEITVHIDGLCASIASIIALAGDKIIMGEGALFMIHLPWTFAGGNRIELDNTVNRLIDIEDQMIGIYARKSKLDRSEIKSMLEKETWLSDDEAIEKGFVDEKAEESLPIAASAFDKTWINRAPRTYKSETTEIQKRIENLKKEIAGTLKAR